MGQRVLPFSSTSKWTYDVFLSFRGEDTRYGFTGNLYHALHQRGIKTFMDDEELRRGEEISHALFKAIQESKIIIIVFSKSYPSSKWCLNELVNIMESFKSKECVVYPVFYNVDPSEVRHQKGSYGEQLAMHEMNLKDNSKKVEKWRLALHEAANLAGWHFRDGYEYEYEFMKGITDMVSSKLDRHLLHVADYPVGLERRVREVILCLHISDPNVTMVGLCGIGGIGKTTLARAVYNSICHQFDGLCFLSDVRENSIKHGLVHLQETILSDIFGEKNIKLGDVHIGIPVLVRRLEHKRVLLILDDVDKLEQLKKLAGGCNWFGSGSRIIITTRCKDILAAHGVGNIYDVPKLSHYDALELLSRNAPKKSQSNASYMAVWNRAVLYSGGLPLALNVIGSDLLGKSTDEWEFALDRYEQVPNEDIQSILKVSYDSLNECEKRIFLDIACFFTGEPLPYVEEILHACGFYPKYGINILIDRSLISITCNGRLMMHDLIKDMAVEIQRQESPMHLGKRGRLWFYKDVLQVFKENVGTDKIEGIMLDYLPQGKEVVQLSDKAFKKMKSLRILIIKSGSFSGVPKHLPNSLRVLEWRGFPATCLPPDFHPANLSILNLPSSCLLNLDNFKNMECLTRMDFTDCKFLSEIPDVSGVPNLRTLYLDSCVSLIKIHDSVGSLGNLEELNAAGCTNLKTIPFALKLASLRFLSFSECPRLVRFPEILSKIENLQHVNLWQTAIEELPFSIGNLVGLESLTLMECTRLVKLPNSIFTLPRLQEIQADSCRGFSFPNECEGHGQLQLTVSSTKIHLYLSSCNLTDEHLVICLTGFAKVVHLDLSYNNFTVLPECIKECIHLKTLLLVDCKQLQDISLIPQKLDDIDALNCTSLTSQSSSVLLSQAFHERGDKIVMLPGSIIPEWFDHCSQERSITFWCREQFPKICVCAAFGVLENLPHPFLVRLSILINGERRVLSQCYSWSIVTDHVWLFDLRVLVNDRNLIRTFMKHDWNHVEVAFEDYQGGEYSTVQVKHEPTRMATVKWYGIHVYRQENSMENILLTNAKTLEESNGNLERFSEGNYMIAQSRDDGAFHDTYYPLCKRKCRR